MRAQQRWGILCGSIFPVGWSCFPRVRFRHDRVVSYTAYILASPARTPRCWGPRESAGSTACELAVLGRGVRSACAAAWAMGRRARGRRLQPQTEGAEDDTEGRRKRDQAVGTGREGRPVGSGLAACWWAGVAGMVDPLNPRCSARAGKVAIPRSSRRTSSSSTTIRNSRSCLRESGTNSWTHSASPSRPR